MVTRPATTKRRTPARRPGARTVPPAVTAVQMDEMKEQLEVAERALQRAGRAAARFARRSVHEVTLAGRASREPMHQVWRAVRLAGRHIARDAAAAWREAVPTTAGAKKPARARAAA
jgi:hypothetical protein